MRRGFLRTDTSHRQIDICCQKYISGEYTSLKEGAKHLPFGQQQFRVYVQRYKEKHPAPVDLGVVTPTPPSYSNREYIDTLKTVSAAVAKERGTDGARSTAKILKDMGCTLLKAAGVNKHIAQNLAGKSPKKRGRQQILQQDAVVRLINYSLECADDLEPLAIRELQETTQALVEGTELQAKFKNGVVSKGHCQRFLKNAADVLQTEFPQAMTHDRADWCTYANIFDYFFIISSCLVQMKISVANPKWAPALLKEREEKGMVEIIHDKPQNICGADEMPFGLDMCKGQKGKADKKITRAAEVIFGGRKKRRQKGRGRQRTSKFNKLGTICYGSKANGEPLIPMLIVKAVLMKPEFTYSEIIGPDGELIKETLSCLFWRSVSRSCGNFIAIRGDDSCTVSPLH
jgi:hypothetical protein